MFISAGSRKRSRKSWKRERQRRLQKLKLRKRNPPGRKQRNKMKKRPTLVVGQKPNWKSQINDQVLLLTSLLLKGVPDHRAVERSVGPETSTVPRNTAGRESQRPSPKPSEVARSK